MRTTLADLIVDSSRLRQDRAPPKSWRDIPIIQPCVVKTDGLHWIAVRTAPKNERFVADNLSAIGFNTYCPLGARFVFWQDGKRSKHRLVKQFPVFFGYIFVGLRTGQHLSKYMLVGHASVLAAKIHSIVGDSTGPLVIPRSAIDELNGRELDAQWDETKRSPFKTEQEIRILSGPLRDFSATVDSATAEGSIRALVTIFGRRTAVTLDADQVEVV